MSGNQKLITRGSQSCLSVLSRELAREAAQAPRSTENVMIHPEDDMSSDEHHIPEAGGSSLIEQSHRELAPGDTYRTMTPDTIGGHVDAIDRTSRERTDKHDWEPLVINFWLPDIK